MLGWWAAGGVATGSVPGLRGAVRRACPLEGITPEQAPPHATPPHPKPSHPKPPYPHPSPLHLSTPPNQTSRHQPNSIQPMFYHAFPSFAIPCHLMPCLPIFCHAMPCHAMPFCPIPPQSYPCYFLFPSLPSYALSSSDQDCANLMRIAWPGSTHVVGSLRMNAPAWLSREVRLHSSSDSLTALNPSSPVPPLLPLHHLFSQYPSRACHLDMLATPTHQISPHPYSTSPHTVSYVSLLYLCISRSAQSVGMAASTAAGVSACAVI